MSTRYPHPSWSPYSMSEDDYEPSNPPTWEDWKHLQKQADHNRRLVDIAFRLGLLALVIALILVAAGTVIYVSDDDVSELKRKNAQVVETQRAIDRQLNAILVELRLIRGQLSTTPGTSP